MASETLTRRELGRATLARQLLLERAPLGAVEAIERLAGMQAQEPRPPFIGLWSRLASFDPQELRSALLGGALIRGPLFRGTLHLVSEADWPVFRPPIQGALAAAARRLGERAAAVDVERLEETARSLLAARPRTSAELRTLLAAAFPGADARALGYVVRMRLPLAMVATEDRWGFPRDPALRLAIPAVGHDSAAELLRRYLAAYGPASAADAQEWTGMSGLGPTFDTMRDELASFVDERGRVLFDLPAAPRPPADTPAPVRFLPEFDSLVLAHADRSRVIADEHRRWLTTKNLRVNATVLHDGEVCATWSVSRRARAATLRIVPFRRLSASARREIEREAEALLAATEPDATGVVVVEDRMG